MRPASETNPLLVTGGTLVLIAVFVVTYETFVRPKSMVAGICLGGLLGLALGLSSGFGSYIHSPIPLALAWAWCAHGTLKGIVAGVVPGTVIHHHDHP